jgi:hypothetical protein
MRHLATREIAGSTRQAPPADIVPQPQYAGANARPEEE